MQSHRRTAHLGAQWGMVLICTGLACRSAVPLPQPGYPAGSASKTSDQSFTGTASGKEIEYSIYLPPGYEDSEQRYPVLYHLHGVGGHNKIMQPLIESLETAMRDKIIAPMIVVFPNGHNNSMWADSKDRAKSTETEVIDDLLPHIDKTYRTLAQKRYRVLQGFSMGGYGAMSYGSRHPDLFVAALNYDGALHNWQTLSERRAAIANEIFSDDEAYYDSTSPWTSATNNVARIKDQIVMWSAVGKLQDFNRAYRDHLSDLGIALDYRETECGHSLPCLLDSEGTVAWQRIDSLMRQL